ncbi:MAG: FAD-dependent oxidoreductase [Rhodospirillaceae bacterium]|nr:FAD-dependent oxidoreductase [Rhodospirillales bacterium]
MNILKPNRRQFIQTLGAATSLSMLPGLAFASGKVKARVVVIGGGFGGATAAKYLRKLSNGAIEVTLIERRKEFISCPASNEVIAGLRDYKTLVHTYDGLKKNWGVKVVHASVVGVDAEKRRVKTDTAGSFDYDKLVLSPGIDLDFEKIAGYDSKAQETILHAWKAGAQTLALRKQLASLENCSTVALTIPKAPYRCPPGPYERATLIAHYLKTHKPKSKILLLDANDKVQSKEKLFTGVWAKDYADVLEYRAGWNAVSVDAASGVVTSELGDKERADILNVLPPQRAADIAHIVGVVNVNGRWSNVDWTTLASTAVPDVHVIGDALQAAPLMPKSGHMANQHGKVVAAAIVDLLSGETPRSPVVANTCYSMVDDLRAIHVDSVHRYDAEKKTLLVVPGSGGVSSSASEAEGVYAHAWAETIWKDVLV